MLQLAVAASNGAQMGSMDIYVYPADLKAFGERLQGFPNLLRGEGWGEANEFPSASCPQTYEAHAFPAR
jgi:hypothetical protein